MHLVIPTLGGIPVRHTEMALQPCPFVLWGGMLWLSLKFLILKDFSPGICDLFFGILYV